MPEYYVYPNIATERMGGSNPYVARLKDALGVPPATATNAFKDLLIQGFRSRYLVLNWIEDLPLRRAGALQTMVFLGCLPLWRLRGTRIVWIKHNKGSHAAKNRRTAGLIQRRLFRAASAIVTHSTDAGAPADPRVHYAPHPCVPSDIPEPTAAGTDIDLLLWGSIQPYKGVREFLEYAAADPFLSGLRIHVEGKCAPEYWETLLPFRNERVTLVNGFLDEAARTRLFNRARFILFTYLPTSVSSSGALTDSLPACKRIIGPKFGAFRDMAEGPGFVTAFEQFGGIADIYRTYKDNFLLNRLDVRNYVLENDWSHFGKRLRFWMEKPEKP